jgi:hypothetical protein
MAGQNQFLLHFHPRLSGPTQNQNTLLKERRNYYNLSIKNGMRELN